LSSQEASEGRISQLPSSLHSFGIEVQQSRKTSSIVLQQSPVKPSAAQAGFLLHSFSTGIPQQSSVQPSFVGQQTLYVGKGKQ